MNFEEALKAMREGEAVRRFCKCYCLIDFCKDNDTIIDSEGVPVILTSEQILADDWQIADIT